MTVRRSALPAAAALLLCTALASSVVPAHAVTAAESLPAVTARAETAPLHDDDQGGNADADDPAIWRNAAAPDRSLVIATAKEGGLRVYDLDARQVQSLPAPPPAGPDDAPGRFNNVDLVHGTALAGVRSDLAVVSDRGHDRLRVYRIDRDNPAGPLTDVTDPQAAPIFSADQEEINEQDTAYGLATWTDPTTRRSYALVSRNNRTTVALLELVARANGTVGYRKVRTLDLPAAFRLPDGTSWSPCGEPGELPQVEGMVVDPANGTLYAGQEDVGIWRVRADLTGTPVLIDKVREYGVPAAYDEESDECSPTAPDPGHGGEHLAADVEGLTLLTEADGDGYVLASSQGDNTFALYDRELADDNEYEAGFRVAASSVLDGAEECDGAAVLNAPLGRKYPNGLLVVQDGDDTPSADDRDATGFKFVDLAQVMDVVDD